MQYLCFSGPNVGTSMYKIVKTVYHNQTTANISFFASNLQNLCDESWAIDNVEVHYKNNSLCDSTVILNLTIDNAVTTTDSVTICYGDNIVVGSSIYDTIGIYIDTLITSNGCDSIINTVVDSSCSNHTPRLSPI